MFHPIARELRRQREQGFFEEKTGIFKPHTSPGYSFKLREKDGVYSLTLTRTDLAYQNLPDTTIDSWKLIRSGGTVNEEEKDRIETDYLNDGFHQEHPDAHKIFRGWVQDLTGFLVSGGFQDPGATVTKFAFRQNYDRFSIDRGGGPVTDLDTALDQFRHGQFNYGVSSEDGTRNASLTFSTGNFGDSILTGTLEAAFEAPWVGDLDVITIEKLAGFIGEIKNLKN